MAIANTDEQLRSIVARIVKLTDDKRAASADIAQLKKEAKFAGYDVKALNLVVKRVMEDEGQRREREDMEAVAASMEAALGEFGSSPLGDAAIKHAMVNVAAKVFKTSVSDVSVTSKPAHATLADDELGHA